MKISKNLLLLLTALALLGGCHSAEDAADAAGKTETPQTAATATEESVPATENKDDGNAPQTPPAPPPNVPAPAPKPAEPPKKSVPALAAKTPATPREIKFRCAYWSDSAKPPELFVKERGKFKHLVIFEMAFLNTFDVPAESPLTLYAEDGRGNYAPYCEIETQGLQDCAALILPGYDPNDPETRKYVRLFNFSENAFPRGAHKIYNFSTRPLELRIKSENAENATVTVVQPGHSVLSKKLSREQERFAFEAYAAADADDAETGGEPRFTKPVWKTIGFLKGDERVCVILIEDAERSRETGKLKLTTKSIPVPNS